MFVNGKYIPDDKVLEALAALPTSFPEYTALRKLEKNTTYLEVSNLFNAGISQMQQGLTTEALQSFETLENIANLRNTPPQVMIDIKLQMARNYSLQGNSSKALEYLEKAAKLCVDFKLIHSAEQTYKNLANFHHIYHNSGTLKAYKKQQEEMLERSVKDNDQRAELEVRYALGAIASKSMNNAEAIKHYSRAYFLSEGRIDAQAYSVEQHEVGFSDHEKIGTHNIQQCVTVIIRDPVTKKTALAHIDWATDPRSLSDVISRFSPDAKLEVHLVGGRDLSPQGLSTSKNNVSKVLTQLALHSNIDIKSADIDEKGSPSGVVFDPQTGKLEHAVPGKVDETLHLRAARIQFVGEHPALHEAFDLTKSKEIPKVTFTKKEKEQLVLRSRNFGNIVGAESWKANVIIEPCTKTLEELNPPFPRSVIKEFGEFIDNVKEAIKKTAQKIKSIFKKDVKVSVAPTSLITSQASEKEQKMLKSRDPKVAKRTKQLEEKSQRSSVPTRSLVSYTPDNAQVKRSTRNVR
jgi:tetratricopeptide (TPR) repeat protein